MIEFFITHLKGVEHRDWMQFRQSLRMAIETSDLFLPGLIGIVGNIIGVWPLIVSYLKETWKKDSGNNLVVCLFHVVFFRKIVTAYFGFPA